MKKIVATMISILFLISTILSGCSNGSNNVEEVEEPLKGNLNIKVRDENKEVVNKVIEKYREKNPEVKISLSSEEEENFDIELISDDEIASYIEDNKDNLKDFTDEDLKDVKYYNKDKKDMYKIDGKRYAIPFYNKPVMMVYNKEKLSEASIDYRAIKTYEDYLSVIDKLQEDSSLIGVISPDYLFKILLNQRNISFDKDNEANDFREEMVEISSILKKIKETSSMVVYDNQDEMIRDFIEGKVVSIILTQDVINKLEEGYKEKVEKIAAEKIPAFNNGGSRNLTAFDVAITVNKNSSNEKIAMDFINFILGDYQVSKSLFDEFSIIPLNNYGIESKDFEKSEKFNYSNSWNKLISITYNSKDYIIPKEYDFLYEKINDVIDRAINQEGDLKTLIEKFQMELWEEEK